MSVTRTAAPRWAAAGGDGDGVVELDELARFTAAWTSRWAREESAGEWDQRPVLWKLGTGRVPLDQVPPGIAIPPSLLNIFKEIERDLGLKPGESTTVAGYEFRFDSTRDIRGPNFDAVEGQVTSPAS
jgi:hypothetical protein